MNGHEESQLTTMGSVQRMQKGRVVIELPASRSLDESEAPACIPVSLAPICFPYEERPSSISASA